MAQKKVRAAIVSQEKLAEGIFSMWLDAPEMAEASRPGQFIAVYTNDPSKLLPRPISICEADKEKGRLRIVYRIAGAGTLEFSRYQAGDTLDMSAVINKAILSLKVIRPELEISTQLEKIYFHGEEDPWRKDRRFRLPGCGDLPGR
mgnify:CR=1 FL=1